MLKKPSCRLVNHARIQFSILTLFFVLSTLTEPFEATQAQSQICPPNVLERFGINVHLASSRNITSYDYGQLNAGWYLDYAYTKPAGDIAGMGYAHVIRTSFDTAQLENKIGPIVDINLGALWLLGNEPDRAGQDAIAAADYATFYHQAYTFLKDRDPTAQVAIAGVVQPTAIRLKYLDAILTAYRQQYGTSLPLDVFNTHNFVMSERLIPEPDSSDIIWGASIPPGISVTDPDIRYLYPSEAWNLDLFKQQLRDLRQWMADNGYRNKPLIVSEYGVLIPRGWDLNGVGTDTYMTESFDFMLSETDEETGYPSDDNRLVQSFSWFSLNFPDYDPSTGQGLTGATFDFESGAMTDLGETYRDYTSNLITVCNIAPTATPVPPTPVPTDTSTPTLTPLPPTPIPVTPLPPTLAPTETPTQITPAATDSTPVNTPNSATPATAVPTATQPLPSVTATDSSNPTTPISTSTPPFTVGPDPTVGETPTALSASTATASPIPTQIDNGTPSNILGSIEGLAWYDFDRDGIYGAETESTLSSMTIWLRWAGADDIYNTPDDTISHGVTTSTGAYRFDDLKPGFYQLMLDIESPTLASGVLTRVTPRIFSITEVGENRAINLAAEGNDLDQDGITDDTEGSADHDEDGAPNYGDPDSDNDGVTDLIEGVADTNGDGQPDYLDATADGSSLIDEAEPIPGELPLSNIYLPVVSN